MRKYVLTTKEELVDDLNTHIIDLNKEIDKVYEMILSLLKKQKNLDKENEENNIFIEKVITLLTFENQFKELILERFKSLL